MKRGFSFWEEVDKQNTEYSVWAQMLGSNGTTVGTITVPMRSIIRTLLLNVLVWARIMH
jgi:hypothetical protein